MFRFIEALIDPLKERPLEQPPEELGAFIRYFLKPFDKILISALLVSGLYSITDLALLAFLGKIVDWMTLTPVDQFFTLHGDALLLMLFMVAIVRPLALIISRSIINLAIVPGTANSVRWQNHRYVLQQSLSFFYSDFAGRIAQKVMQTGNALREALINIIDGIWILAIHIAGAILLLLQLDSWLILPIIIWVIGYASVIIYMVPPVRAKSAALSEATSHLTGRIVDSYTNILSVKLFADSKQEEAFCAQGIANHNQAFQQLMRSVLGMTSVLTLLNTLLITGSAGLSIYLWRHQIISIGDIALINGLVLRINQMSGWILRTITALFENIGTVQNGIETISQPTRIKDSSNAKDLIVSEGKIEFKDIHFGYRSQQQDIIINGINLSIKAGEKVGLVGRSGAGKSTLVNLLMRLYELDKGEILIDGQDINLVTQHSLRQQITMVTQDTSLLHRSVRDNIKYGRPEATDEQMHAAAESAKAELFIPKLIDPEGRESYEAQVGERGVKLSGGQRQRIAIARVILKDAPILILDEATSALDSEVEAAIQEQLDNLMSKKTVIAIAHRLSTIAALDRLVVIDDGQIVEQGSHDELLTKNGLYAQLWARQSGGFLGLKSEDNEQQAPNQAPDPNT